jgi:hypothetical protein
MNSRTKVLFATVGMWLVAVVVLGEWRLIYAWRWGAGVIFFFQYIPVLVLFLVVILLSEFLYFRRNPGKRQLK